MPDSFLCILFPGSPTPYAVMHRVDYTRAWIQFVSTGLMAAGALQHAACFQQADRGPELGA
jgi:hypothetical protein